MTLPDPRATMPRPISRLRINRPDRSTAITMSQISSDVLPPRSAETSQRC